MMCYYLNVQFQGQRVKDVVRDDLSQKHKFVVSAEISTVTTGVSETIHMTVLDHRIFMSARRRIDSI